MKNRILATGLLIILFCSVSCIKVRNENLRWHHPMYMANNDYWRQRIPVIIRNKTKRDLAGDAVQVQIGSHNGQVPLEGIPAEGIRVTNDNGAELLFRISDSAETLVQKGPIPGNSSITFPAECGTDTLITNYIYFENPSAWAVGDYFTYRSTVNDSITITILEKERLNLKEVGQTEKWYDDDPNDQIEWQSRAAVKTINFGVRKSLNNLVCVNIEGPLNRLHAEMHKNTAIQVTDGIRPVPYYRIGDYILFIQDIRAATEHNNYVYFNSGDKTGENLNVVYLENLNDSGHNLVQNSDFEEPDLTGWTAGSEKGIEISRECKKGEGSIKLQIAVGEKDKEIYMEQTLPVNSYKQYFFSSWIKCSDTVSQPDFLASIQQRVIRIRFISGDGNPVGRVYRFAVDPERYMDNDWLQLYALMTAPENADSVNIQLANASPGSVWFDEIIFTEVITGTTSPLAIERKASGYLKEVTVWQEDPVVKVFQDDLPPAINGEISISVARNEVEPLQLVIRSPEEYKGLRIEITTPSDLNGNKIDQLETGVIGYVPVNYPSNYITDRVTPAWHQKIPSGSSGSDGWIGMWPDPILPFQSLDLPSNSTQPVWIEIKVPKDAVPGDYSGLVHLIHKNSVIKDIPFKVHVWDFTLPDISHMAAVYDARTRNRNFFEPGKSQNDLRRDIWKILADHRLNPDMITPAPEWKIENGRIHFDFTEFDKAAHYYFDTLKFTRAYSPQYFYCFTWANLPGEKFGELPYPGEYPYPDTDRGKLRPEFKRAYQSALRQYWNHMMEKGWADKVVLYISDEPHSEPDITAQMRALCDMIHEVDPKIPVYVSTWWYRPEYVGYVNVWGVSNHGGGWGRPVPESDLIKIRQTGGRLFFTTDGKMCTDTPYLGFERMLPYFCFKYGAEEYEFWAAAWYTLNPYEYGWHSFIRQSDRPGDQYWIRYPNGDGNFIYPGNPIGVNSLVATIRLKLAREGVEDYEYLYYLDSLMTVARNMGKNIRPAEKAIESAFNLVTIPSAEGRYSTEYLPDPYAVLRVKRQVAEAIEELLMK